MHMIINIIIMFIIIIIIIIVMVIIILNWPLYGGQEGGPTNYELHKRREGGRPGRRRARAER